MPLVPEFLKDVETGGLEGREATLYNEVSNGRAHFPINRLIKFRQPHTWSSSVSFSKNYATSTLTRVVRHRCYPSNHGISHLNFVED